MKERINEHDMTKKMMSMIRGGYQNVLVKENSDDVKAVEIEKNTPIYKDELKKYEFVHEIIKDLIILNLTVYFSGFKREIQFLKKFSNRSL